MFKSENKDKVISLIKDRVKLLKKLEKLNIRQEKSKSEFSFEKIGESIEEIEMDLWNIDQNFKLLVKKL